jgi:hypothetical protein|tara:strand:- start:165 stop:341 length:177 start_codon:yes stop_codon:yes gene_type:complete
VLVALMAVMEQMGLTLQSQDQQAPLEQTLQLLAQQAQQDQQVLTAQMASMGQATQTQT